MKEQQEQHLKKKKIDKKRLLVKASEDGIKKAVEYLIIGIFIGLSLKILILAVSGVMFGSILAKALKLNLIDLRG